MYTSYKSAKQRCPDEELYNACNVEFLIRTSLLRALANRMVLTTCTIVHEACLGVAPL